MTEQDDTLPSASSASSGSGSATASGTPPIGPPRAWPRRLWQLCVTLLVSVAIWVTAGRLLMPVVANRADATEAQLSRLLGAPVSIGTLRGAWFRFGPSLEISDLVITADGAAGPATHRVQRAFAALDVARTLLQRRPVITRLNIEGVDVVVQEHADGSWGLAGFASGGLDYSDQILDFLLDTPDIALTGSRLLLRRADGTQTGIESVYLQLQNRGDQHELAMQAQINGQLDPSRLSATLAGDPRGDYTAAVHGSLGSLDIAPLLAAVPLAGWQLQSARVAGAFWLDIDSAGPRQLTARVSDLQLQAASEDGAQTIAIQNGAFTLAAQPEGAARDATAIWNLRVADIGFAWQERAWEVPVLHVRLPLDAAAPLSLQVSALDLGMLRVIAASALPLSARVRAILTTLAPRGLLRDIHVDTRRDGNYPEGFLLRANLDEVAVSAWGAAPASSGLTGYLQMQAGAGFAEVDSRDLTLHLPRLFDAAWHYDNVNTRVHWEYAGSDFRIASTPIEVENTSLKGRVQFDLLSTLNPQQQRISELTLLVGMDTLDVASGSVYLPSLPRLRPTLDWLAGALQSGQLRNSGLVLRTSSPPTLARGDNTFASWYEVSDGSVQFLPDWPALEGIDGSVSVRDGVVQVSTETAAIGGVQLNAATARVQPQAGGGSLLTVRGTADAGTDQGLAFLRNTPVRDTLGPFLDNWQASGAVHADIALDIPLGDSAGQRQIAVDVASSASELYIADYALTIGAIDGLVSFRSDTGLAATALNARLFDMPIVASIKTTLDPATAERSTLISSRGSASVAALQEWPGQPQVVSEVLGFMSGVIDYRAALSIFPQNSADGIRTSLDIDTDLVGMQSRLPLPFTKSQEEVAALKVRLDFLEDEQLLTASYADFMSAQLVLGAAGIDRGQLNFGARNRTFNVRQTDVDAAGLLINGELPYFDYAEWQAVFDRISAPAETGSPEPAGPAQRSLADYLRLIDIDIDTLVILGQQLQDINVQVTHEPNGWYLQGINTLLSGRFMLPVGTAQPWLIDLDYLRFPPRDEPELMAEGAEVEEEKVDMLVAVNPVELPPMDFTTAELSIGPQNLGAFSFRLRPNASGATIANFRMVASDASISDLQQTGGANLDWRYTRGMHTSSFNGLFAAGNLASVLPAWGHNANVESQSARFSGTLQWKGSPLAFALKDASGQVLMDIARGRFVDIQANSSRVFSALNFDALVRRLQLDFSDLFQRGFSFDRISGNLNFDQGVVTTNGAVLIEGSSSRISINGEIDLAAETIAADMEVQIPLGQNISMLAGLLGAWPIALSTYLASKIFSEQVGNFATMIYRLEGPWETPTAGFEPPPTDTTEAPQE